MQQFIKIAALKNIKKDNINIIWDADTIPLKKIIFLKSKKVLFYKGDNYLHKPYFDLIKKTFPLEKKTNQSFISQNMPCKGQWINAFFNYFIKTHKVSWEIFFINNINFKEQSGFSEYETLGNFFYEKFGKYIKFLENNWLRRGYLEINSLKKFYFVKDRLSKKYDYIAFEKWDKGTLLNFYEKSRNLYYRLLSILC